MLAPTARLLELLELLQAQTLITGGEIAGRLRIDARTVRRYVAALQALGIPVEGQRGVGGGYRIRPGFRLPPLMLNDDEAVVVAAVQWPHEVEVELELPLEEATRRLPATLAELTETDGGTLLRMRVCSLDWTASVLAGLGCDFTIRMPAELRASVRALAARVAACA